MQEAYTMLGKVLAYSEILSFSQKEVDDFVYEITGVRGLVVPFK